MSRVEIGGSLRSKWQASPGRSSEERWGDLTQAVGQLKKDNTVLFVSHRQKHIHEQTEVRL